MNHNMFQVLNAIDLLCGPPHYTKDIDKVLEENGILPMPECLNDLTLSTEWAARLIQYGVDYVESIGCEFHPDSIPGFTEVCKFIDVWVDWHAMPQDSTFWQAVSSTFPNQPIIGGRATALY